MSTWEKFKKHVFSQRLIEPGDGILAGVSGGPDSVCMLHLLWRLKKTIPLTIFAVHFDHGLRSVAAKDSRFVEKLGKDLGIQVDVQHIKVNTFSDEKNVSVETAGRTLRYQGFEVVAKKFRCTKIATGHNANDNAETVLMWLARGTGTDGMTGIPVQRPVGAGCEVIRPILSLTRDEIIGYLKDQGVRFRMDSTNRDKKYTRNRLRHELMPLMKKFNPRFVEHIYNLSKITANEIAYIDSFVQAAIRKFSKKANNQISFDLSAFFKYNKTIQSRILRKLIPEKCSVFHIENLLDWINKGKGVKPSFSNGWIVKKTPRNLLFVKR